MELAKVLSAVRRGTFKLDVTRSGRFVELLQQDRQAPDVMGPPVITIDVEPKDEERCEITSEVVPSSSSSSSEGDFQNQNARVFQPPTPPEGYVFWQHKKLRTLHVAMPDYRRN